MANIKTGPNEIAQWHQIVLEAQSETGFYVPEPIEQYVVMTLHAYTANSSLSSVVVAIDFLQALKDTSTISLQKLRDVGDQCLILSGLFPERAKRKNVSPVYFEKIGKEAYYSLSFAPTRWHVDQHVFYQLFENFSRLIQVLQALRMNENTLLH